MLDAKSFLDIVSPKQQQSNGFRLATVQTVVTSPYPGVTVLFDGESTAALKVYPTLTTVGIEPDARVLLVPVSTSMVVVGALGEGYIPPAPTPGLIVTTYTKRLTTRYTPITANPDQALTSTAITVTTTTPNAVAIVSAAWDFRQSGTQYDTPFTFIGKYYVDGAEFVEDASFASGKQALVIGWTNVRLASTQNYRIPIATPGNHTFQMYVNRTAGTQGAGTGIPQCMEQHTGHTITVYETP